MEAWTPERVVDRNLARALVDSQFPELSGKPIEPFGVGFDNTAYLVGGEWVFRFPRREVAAPLMNHELAVLADLSKTLPLRVPVPEKIGKSTAEFPWSFAGYRVIPGRSATHAHLSDDARAQMAPTLGEFLAKLHSFPVKTALEHGVPGDDWKRANLEHRRDQALPHLDELKSMGRLDRPLAAELRDILVHTRKMPLPGRALLHGDLYSRHLLVDAAGKLSGVIDWGDVHVGEAAIDLSIAFIFLPPSSRVAFRRAYGPTPEAQWEFARFRAVYHSLATLRFAHEIKDGDLIHECEQALRWCTE